MLSNLRVWFEGMPTDWLNTEQVPHGDDRPLVNDADQASATADDLSSDSGAIDPLTLVKLEVDSYIQGGTRFINFTN